MDRINGADTVDIGGGNRGFRDENVVAGVIGTEVTAAHLNSLQEEILKVIEEAGIDPDSADWTQLWQALQLLTTVELPWADDLEFADVGNETHIATIKQIWTLISGLQFDVWIEADVTYTIGSNGADDFATINDAMAYLKTWLIADGATVTLLLRAEVHAMAANIVIDHPMSHKIEIVGAAMAGAVPAVGDFVVTGNSPAQIIADNVTNIAMLRTRYSTEIAFTGAFGFVINTPLGLLKNTLIVGDGSVVTGITVQNEVRIVTNTVSVHGFGQIGIDMNTARCLVLGGCLTASGTGSDGISVRNGSNLDAMNATALIVVSAGLNGLTVKFASAMRAAAGVTRLTGCVSSGLQVSDVSAASVDGVVIRDNKDGVSVARNSHVYMRNASSRYNETYGVYVESHSAVDIAGGNFNGNSSPTADVLVTSQSFAAAQNIAGSTSPAANTIGNHNSLIRT